MKLWRTAAACVLCCVPALAWIESAEFQWQLLPPHLWERELLAIKNTGIRHVSLPLGASGGKLSEVVDIVRRLGMEADLGGPIPEQMGYLAKSHGGPLTDSLAAAFRISPLQSNALVHSRELILNGAQSIVWTRIHDTISEAGFTAGVVSFEGRERAATAVLRRNSQVAAFWSAMLPRMQAALGAAARVPVETIDVKQWIGETGDSLVVVTNSSGKDWTGDVKAMYPEAHRLIVLPNVTVAANDTVWLPMNIPLANGFSPHERLVYATSEITLLEYENGILGMEFSSSGTGEAVLQLSRQPSGPLMAGGKPAAFDWDEEDTRARLPIPTGAGANRRVRIGLAVQPPDATAFFDTARTLLTGEENVLRAEFSSEAIAQRSRVVAPGLIVTQAPGAGPLEMLYTVKVPDTAVPGDFVDIALEADGVVLSRAHPQLLRPVVVRFPDAVLVQAGADASLTLDPAVIAVNRRNGRDITVTLRNNAAEIRTFQLALQTDGADFSPTKTTLTVGASESRDFTFRIFPKEEGLREGFLTVTARGGKLIQALRFLLVPVNEEMSWTANGFTFLENEKMRAAFYGERLFEYTNKESGANLLAPGGVPFKNSRPLSFTDLDAALAKAK